MLPHQRPALYAKVRLFLLTLLFKQKKTFSVRTFSGGFFRFGRESRDGGVRGRIFPCKNFSWGRDFQ